MIAAVEPFNWNALVQLLTLLIGAWIAWQQQQRIKAAKEERETLNEVKTGLNEVKVATDGMKEALVEAEKSAAKSKGKEEERGEERLRVAEAKAAVADAKPAEPIEAIIVNLPDQPIPASIIDGTTPEKAPPEPTPVVVVNPPEKPLPVEDVSAGAVPKKK